MSWKVYVNKNKCDGCAKLHKSWEETNKYKYRPKDKGECVLVCPVEVFEMDNNKSIPINEQWCIGCQSCMDVCPTQAVDVTYE